MNLSYQRVTIATTLLTAFVLCASLTFVGEHGLAQKSGTNPGQSNTTTTRTNNPDGSSTVTTTTTYKDGSTTTTTNYDPQGHDAGSKTVDKQTKDGETTTTTTTRDGNGHETGKTVERVAKDGTKTVTTYDGEGRETGTTTFPPDKKPTDFGPNKPKDWLPKIEPQYESPKDRFPLPSGTSSSRNSGTQSSTNPGQGNTTTTRTNNPDGSTTVTTTTTYKDGSTTTTTKYDQQGHDAGTTRVDKQTKDGETTTTTTTYDGNGHETGKTIERVDKDGNKTIIIIDPATGGVKSSTTIPAEPKTPPEGKPIDLPPFKYKPDWKIEPRYITVSAGYKVETTASPGLNILIVTGPNGKLIFNMPNELHLDETYSGTALTEPAGKTEADRARNQAELNGMVLFIGQQPTQVSEKTFTRTIPANLTSEAQALVLMRNGKAVVNSSIPILNGPPPAPPSTVQLPTGGQMGGNVVVSAPCNGVGDPTDSMKIGGQETRFLAESPRERVATNTSQVAGPTQIEFKEQGKVTTGPFQNIGVRLSGNTNLVRDQEGLLKLVVFGLQGIQQPLPVDLENNSSNVVGVSGGDVQHFDILPGAVASDGTWNKTFTMTGRSAGVFNITAIVRWKNPCQPGQPGCQGPMPPCSAGAHQCGEGLKYWCSGDDKPCEPPPCGAGAHQCGEGLKYWCSGDDKPCEPPPCGAGAHQCGEGLKYWCTGDDKPCQPGPSLPTQPQGNQPTPSATPAPPGQTVSGQPETDKEAVLRILNEMNIAINEALRALEQNRLDDANAAIAKAKRAKEKLFNVPSFANTSVLGQSVADWLQFVHFFDEELNLANVFASFPFKDAEHAKGNLRKAEEYKKALEKKLRGENK